MDIRCPKCGEPWDMDTLHEEAEHRQGNDVSSAVISYETAYSAISADFRRRGCAAITCYGAKCSKQTADPVISALYDLLGDDLDGAASMLEDYESLYGDV